LLYTLRKTESIDEADIALLEMLKGCTLDELRENGNSFEATYDWYALYMVPIHVKASVKNFFLSALDLEI